MSDSKTTNTAECSATYFKQSWRSKPYRAALHKFRSNILETPTPLNYQPLPMSPVPRAQQNENLTIVHVQQIGKEDHITLIVPIEEFLTN